MENAAETAIALLPIQGPLRLALEEACGIARLKLTPTGLDISTGSKNDSKASALGSLVVAELAVGERRIPKRALDVVERLGGHTKLLLLCPEPLARPSITLQGGRVTLIGPPVTAGRLASLLRILQADMRGVRDGKNLEGREWLSEKWWIAAFRSRNLKPSSALQMQLNAREGFLSIFPPPGAAMPAEQVRHLAQELSCEQGERERLAAMRRASAGSGVVHLTANADRWLIHWPFSDWHLSLSSRMRVPGHYNLANALSRKKDHSWSLAASPGDLLLACDGPVADDDGGKSLREAKDDGGPATWDLLETRAQQSSDPQCGLLVEVR